ncbi:hypothetical protein LCGC14_0609910 [marine sediment metagenome]|uniref:Uncharacterized protein n=1 Tax=marine sediment metagenome TaxID=412755 RepID=A0A0F9R840_9ZZZZ
MTKRKTILGDIAEARLQKGPPRTQLSDPDMHAICRMVELEKTVPEIAKLMRRDKATIYRFLASRRSSRAYTEMLAESQIHILGARALEEANVTEALEILNRMGVKGFVKRDKVTSPTMAIQIVQAPVPDQVDMDRERDRVEAIRNGTVTEKQIAEGEVAETISIPGLTTVEAPK